MAFNKQVLAFLKGLDVAKLDDDTRNFYVSILSDFPDRLATLNANSQQNSQKKNHLASKFGCLATDIKIDLITENGEGSDEEKEENSRDALRALAAEKFVSYQIGKIDDIKDLHAVVLAEDNDNNDKVNAIETALPADFKAYAENLDDDDLEKIEKLALARYMLLLAKKSVLETTHPNLQEALFIKIATAAPGGGDNQLRHADVCGANGLCVPNDILGKVDATIMTPAMKTSFTKYAYIAYLRKPDADTTTVPAAFTALYQNDDPQWVNAARNMHSFLHDQVLKKTDVKALEKIALTPKENLAEICGESLKTQIKDDEILKTFAEAIKSQAAIRLLEVLANKKETSTADLITLAKIPDAAITVALSLGTETTKNITWSENEDKIKAVKTQAKKTLMSRYLHDGAAPSLDELKTLIDTNAFDNDNGYKALLKNASGAKFEDAHLLPVLIGDAKTELRTDALIVALSDAIFVSKLSTVTAEAVTNLAGIEATRQGAVTTILSTVNTADDLLVDAAVPAVATLKSMKAASDALNKPVTTKGYQALAMATNRAEFIKAMKELDPTFGDGLWMNERTRVAMQQTAAGRIFEDKIKDEVKEPLKIANYVSMFTSKHNSLAAQQEALKNPRLAMELNQAKTGDDILKAVGTGFKFTASETKLANTVLLQKVHNAALAEIFVKMDFAITEDKVNQINKKIRGLSKPLINDGEYRLFVYELSGILGREFTAEENAKFGINPQRNGFLTGDLTTVGTPQKAITDQANFNQDLFPADDAFIPLVTNYLLTLKKGGALSEGQVKLITDAINNGMDLNNIPAPAVNNELRAAVAKISVRPEAGLTNAALAEAQALNKAYRERVLSKEVLFAYRFKHVLSTDKTRYGQFNELISTVNSIVDEVKTFEKSGSSAHKSFEVIGQLSSLQWINPAFQATAYKHKEKLGEYKAMAAEAKNIVIFLKKQQGKLLELKELFDVNVPAENQKYKEQELTKINEALDVINKQLPIYERALKKLNGDPSLPKDELGNTGDRLGIVKSIEAATGRDSKDKQQIKFLKFDATMKPVSINERKYFTDDYKNNPEGKSAIKEDVPAFSADVAKSDPTFEFVEAIKEGEAREYTVQCKGNDNTNTHVATAVFVEKNNPDSRNAPEIKTRKKETSIHENQAATLSLMKWPEEKDAAGQDVDPKVLEQQRMHCAFAFASQLLARYDGVPTKANPITLSGPNKEMGRYVWTALMCLGEGVPDCKFGPSAIVRAPDCAFYPDEEMTLGGLRYKDSSLMKSVFRPELKKNNSAYLAGVKQVIETQHTKESENALKAVSNITSSTFQKLKAGVEGLRKGHTEEKPDDSPAPR